MSVYQQPGKALLVILNSATADKPVKLTLDAKTLGLTTPNAEDGATHEKLPVAGNSLTVTVPARDFRMVVVK